MSREIILGIMFVLFIIAYIKVGVSIDKEKPSGVNYVVLMAFLFGLSILLNFTLIKEEEDFEQEIKELKQGLPQYEEVHGLYRLKK